MKKQSNITKNVYWVFLRLLGTKTLKGIIIKVSFKCLLRYFARVLTFWYVRGFLSLLRTKELKRVQNTLYEEKELHY